MPFHALLSNATAPPLSIQGGEIHGHGWAKKAPSRGSDGFCHSSGFAIHKSSKAARNINIGRTNKETSSAIAVL